MAGLAVEGLHPRRGGRWSGRWRGPDGRRIYGLFDPATGAVRVVDPSRDPKLPALAHWAPRGRLVAYRPTRRAVVRVSGPTRYVKIVRPGRVATLARAHAAVEAARPAGGPAYPRVAPVLEWSDADGVIVLGEVAGRSVHDLLVVDTDTVTADLERVAEALAAFHRPAVRAADGLPPAGGRSLEDWVDLVAPLVPDGTRRIYATALAALPPAPVAGGDARHVHGDLHDRNVLLAAGDVGLVDLDSLGAGHPAADVGNLAAHLVLRSLQVTGAPDRGRRQSAALAGAYRAAAGPADDTAVAVATARAQFRLACVYAVRPRWQHLCPTLLAEAG